MKQVLLTVESKDRPGIVAVRCCRPGIGGSERSENFGSNGRIIIAREIHADASVLALWWIGDAHSGER